MGIPPKSVQVNFLWVKMTSERLLNSFIPPKTFIPQNKFLSMPLYLTNNFIPPALQYYTIHEDIM